MSARFFFDRARRLFLSLIVALFQINFTVQQWRDGQSPFTQLEVAGVRSDVVLASHPRIGMGLLRRHGMFVSDVRLLVFEFGRIDVSIKHYPEENDLCFLWKSSTHEKMERIKIDLVLLKYGCRKYFICPLSGKRTSELHLVNDTLGCRQAHPRLSVNNGSPTQRFELRISRWRAQLLGEQGYVRVKGKMRSRIVQRLKAVPYITNRFPKLDQEFHEEEQLQISEARRKAQASMRSGALSLASAFSAGRDIETSGVLDGHGAWAPEIWLASIAEPSGQALNAPLAELEAHAALDVRALAALGLGKTALAAHGLLWRQPDRTEFGRAILVADFRLANHPFLAVRSLDGADGAIPVQFVRLVPSATAGRWFLECPLLGARCDILYLRAGRFASAKANRLVHRSQRKAT